MIISPENNIGLSIIPLLSSTPCDTIDLLESTTGRISPVGLNTEERPSLDAYPESMGPQLTAPHIRHILNIQPRNINNER
jgi:hypothetical protein